MTIWYVLALAPIALLCGLLIGTVRAYYIAYKRNRERAAIPPRYALLVALSYLTTLVPMAIGATKRVATDTDAWLVFAYAGSSIFAICVVTTILLSTLHAIR